VSADFFCSALSFIIFLNSVTCLLSRLRSHLAQILGFRLPVSITTVSLPHFLQAEKPVLMYGLNQVQLVSVWLDRTAVLQFYRNLLKSQ